MDNLKSAPADINKVQELIFSHFDIEDRSLFEEWLLDINKFVDHDFPPCFLQFNMSLCHPSKVQISFELCVLPPQIFFQSTHHVEQKTPFCYRFGILTHCYDKFSKAEFAGLSQKIAEAAIEGRLIWGENDSIIG